MERFNSSLGIWIWKYFEVVKLIIVLRALEKLSMSNKIFFYLQSMEMFFPFYYAGSFTPVSDKSMSISICSYS